MKAGQSVGGGAGSVLKRNQPNPTRGRILASCSVSLLFENIEPDYRS